MFYFFNIVFLLFFALMYAVFREGYLFAKRISKTSKLRGAMNYWWLEGVKESNNLGFGYYINKIFTILYLAVALFVVAFGLFNFARVAVVVMIGVLGAFLVPMSFYGFANVSRKEYDKPFVFLAKRKDKTGKYHTSITDVIFSLLPIFMVLFDVYYFL